jgi:hypothetical protein
MKTFMLLLFTFICGCASTAYIAEPSTPIKSDVSFNMTKGIAFIQAMKWFNSHFNDSKSVISYQDKEAGVIIGKYLAGTFNYNTGIYGQGGIIAEKYSIIEVEIKDNFASIKITPDYVIQQGITKAYWQNKCIPVMKANNNALLESFKTAFQ